MTTETTVDLDTALAFAIYGYTVTDEEESPLSYRQEVSRVIRKNFKTPAKFANQLNRMVNLEHYEFVESLYNVFNLWSTEKS